MGDYKPFSVPSEEGFLPQIVRDPSWYLEQTTPLAMRQFLDNEMGWQGATRETVDFMLTMLGVSVRGYYTEEEMKKRKKK